jgi:SAM-dependent methyltransferase
MGVNNVSNKLIIESIMQVHKQTPPLNLSMVILGSQIMRPKVRQQFKSAKRHYESMSDIFSDVVCIDTNGKMECLKKDLNEPLKEMHGSFDVLFNGGTMEHVTKQLDGWRNCHYLLREDGIFIHVSPLVGGWPKHGKYLYKESFFVELIKANKYKPLIMPQIISHPKGDAVYLSFQKTRKGVFYFKQAEPHIVKV